MDARLSGMRKKLAMHTIKLWIDRFLATICITLCGLLTFVVTWQVINRYIFSGAGAMTEELAKIMFVWLVLLGSALLFGEKGHMNIGIFVEAFSSQRLKGLFQLSTDVLILLFVVAILLIGGLDAVDRTMRQTNAAIPFLKTGQIYLALPLSGAFSAFYCLYNIWNDIRALLQPAKAEPAKGEAQ
ncbi:TRAP-type C4-dicarboxylate transport system permease small subunit [Martelella mediterranea]|uniref:TRAP transporter small permease protein n=2 Tax=Martelella mediterranea TaxID=293089 RepID=A0A4R3NI39_9HYPH|nr:TRAP-type C4-dicarboxylate transport system permease small subunit [Martelella mediterranea]